jgi:hypothetical protein
MGSRSRSWTFNGRGARHQRARPPDGRPRSRPVGSNPPPADFVRGGTGTLRGKSTEASRYMWTRAKVSAGRSTSATTTSASSGGRSWPEKAWPPSCCPTCQARRRTRLGGWPRASLTSGVRRWRWGGAGSCHVWGAGGERKKRVLGCRRSSLRRHASPQSACPSCSSDLCTPHRAY